MFGLQTLDVAIGLVFIYLVLSLICTALNEAIAGWFHLRASTLRDGIENLITGRGFRVAPARQGTSGAAARGAEAVAASTRTIFGIGSKAAAGQVTAAAFYDHPLIKSLEEERALPFAKRWPSYIPTRTFVLALLDLITDGARQTPSEAALTAASSVVRTEMRSNAGDRTTISITETSAAHEAAVAAMRKFKDALADPTRLDPYLQRQLQVLLEDSRGDVRRLQQSLEHWFDDAMARVSAVYKRKAQLITFTLGAIVATALNADTLALVRSLSTDPALRQALVGQASRAVGDSARAFRELSDTKTLERLQTLGLPLGWPPIPKSTADSLSRPEVTWLTRQKYVARRFAGLALPHWPGLLVTAFAISIGAPFWFDMLNKIINIRSSGRSPEEEPKSPEVAPPARG